MAVGYDESLEFSPMIREKVITTVSEGSTNFQPDLTPKHPSWDLACIYNQAPPLWTVEGMFQTCFRRIHVFLVVMGCLDWPEGRHADDGLHALNAIWVRLTQLTREKKEYRN